MPVDDFDLVVGIDSSTQSTKAIAWDRAGRPVAEGRAPVPMTTRALGRVEQEPEDWWRSLAAAATDLTTKVEARRIGALAISNQRETMGFLDAEGRSIRPGMVWLDERGRSELPDLVRALGADRFHKTTGKPVDPTPAVSRLAWLRRREPERFAATALFVDVQTYLVGRLTGVAATSWASCDPLGLFDIEEKIWWPEVLAYLGLTEDRLPRNLAPGAPLGVVTEAAARATGLAVGTPVIAGGGDGQCAGLGTNCAMPGRAYLNLGTALVNGVWSPTNQWRRDWRTLISATGTGYSLETVQRTGALLIDWLPRALGGATDLAAAHKSLAAAAEVLPIGSDGLLTLPYWSGCMDPHWDPDATGCLVGLTSSHTAAHVYRSMLEGLTLECARAGMAMRAAGVAIDEMVVIGGGAKSALWVQMIADATGRPVAVCGTVEASALGAGMLAAFGAGWYPTIEDAAAAMAGATTPIEPDAARHDRYQALMAIHGDLYQANRDILRRAAAFARGDSADSRR